MGLCPCWRDITLFLVHIPMNIAIKNTTVGEALLKIKPEEFRQAFLDPPDNIGLKYHSFGDNRFNYIQWLGEVIEATVARVPIVWVSFNAKWISHVCRELFKIEQRQGITARMMVQTFTFGQHRTTDFGNNYRPIFRITWDYQRTMKSFFYPDDIRIESARQRAGDPRANPEGRVPGDVFDFPRVTGNSHQRRKWHPTQLHEGLVERCLKSGGGGPVLDLFSGTGTTLRVCKKLGYDCLAVESDRTYCENIARENDCEII